MYHTADKTLEQIVCGAQFNTFYGFIWNNSLCTAQYLTMVICKLFAAQSFALGGNQAMVYVCSKVKELVLLEKNSVLI